jgi:hypothetical protein
VAVEGDAAGRPRRIERGAGRSAALDRSRHPQAAPRGLPPQTVVAEIQAKLAAMFGIET